MIEGSASTRSCIGEGTSHEAQGRYTNVYGCAQIALSLCLLWLYPLESDLSIHVFIQQTALGSTVVSVTMDGNAAKTKPRIGDMPEMICKHVPTRRAPCLSARTGSKVYGAAVASSPKLSS